MSDIEGYLAELRSHLGDLDPRRAEEVVAEARTHLAARVAQLQAQGMACDDAVTQAARTFGLPCEVAVELVKANHHCRRDDDRAALALLLAFAGFCIAGLLLPGPPSWLWNLDRRLAADTFLVPNQLGILTSVLVSSPIAFLAGLLAGKRRWWVAGLPPVLFGSVLGILRVAQIVLWRGVSVFDTDEIIVAATLILLAGPLLAACGLLGSRFRKPSSRVRSQAE